MDHTKEPTDREQAYEKLGLVDPMPGTYQRIIAEELSSLRSDLAEKTAQTEKMREALTNIYDYGLDRDGEYEAEKLSELVDELVELAREALAATASDKSGAGHV